MEWLGVSVDRPSAHAHPKHWQGLYWPELTNGGYATAWQPNTHVVKPFDIIIISYIKHYVFKLGRGCLVTWHFSTPTSIFVTHRHKMSYPSLWCVTSFMDGPNKSFVQNCIAFSQILSWFILFRRCQFWEGLGVSRTPLRFQARNHDAPVVKLDWRPCLLPFTSLVVQF